MAGPEPYPPSTPEQAASFLREKPSIDAILMAMRDREVALANGAPFLDRNGVDHVFEILRQGLDPFPLVE